MRAYHPPVPRAARLREVPIFADLDEAALERISELATEADVPEGALMIERNQPGSGLFLILEGRVRVELTRKSVEVGPGELVGELSLLADGPRRGRALALTDVRCLAISRQDFGELVESEPRIAVAMLSVLARRLAALLDHRG